MPDPATAAEPFDQEAMDAIKAGHAVPVWSEVLQGWLWWVRDEPARKLLIAQGCKVPIYTLGELVLVAGMDADALQDIHAIKREFGAVIFHAKPTPQDLSRDGK